MKIGPSGLSPIERFYSHIGERSDIETCWLWNGPLNNRGYGVFNIRTMDKWKVFLAHRFSWLLAYGGIYGNDCILHHCDTPRCVNPSHLFAGSHKDNALDKVMKKRHRWGESVPNSKLTEVQAMEIIRGIDNSERLVDIADRMNIEIHLVKSISRGVTWKHLRREHV